MKGECAWGSWWVTQKWIGHEEAGTDEAESEEAQQERSPGGTFAWVQHAPESDGKAEHEDAAEEEVGDLHPASFAQAERADKVVPGAVVGARGPFDEEHDDEEQRTECATGKQKSERQRANWLLSPSFY